MDFDERFTCPECGAGVDRVRVSYVVRASHAVLPGNDRPDEVLVGWDHEAGAPDPRAARPSLRCERCGESLAAPLRRDGVRDAERPEGAPPLAARRLLRRRSRRTTARVRPRATISS
jgi:hypothetical protein